MGIRLAFLISSLLLSLACVDRAALSQRCDEDHGCDEGDSCVDGECIRSPIGDDAGALQGDAGGGVDAGEALDAGVGGDAGGAVDAGESTDSGSSADAGSPGDAGSPADAGGSGVDAGVLDAGVDAGPCPDAGVLTTIYFDSDDDDVSDYGGARCYAGTLPATGSLTPRFAPVLGIAPAVLQSIGNGDVEWNNMDTERLVRDDGDVVRSDDLDGEPFTDVLTLTDFSIEAPPSATAVRGIRVHIAREYDQDESFGSLADKLVQIVAGLRTSENKADTLVSWTPGVLEWVSYGGPDDDWGLSLTAADVEAADFGVGLQVSRYSGDNERAEIDAVIIEVFFDAGELDCDPLSPTRYLEAELFVDNDEDFHVPDAGPPMSECIDWQPPVALTLWRAGWDCYDDHANAYDGSGSSGSTDRGDGSYDYDCDGVTTKLSVTSALSCTCATFCNATNETYTPSAACGEQTNDDRCTGTCAGCTKTQDTSAVRCR